MRQHTPGPWRVEQQDDMDVEGNGYVWAVRAEGHGSYCQNPARSNSLANARLMAASPELLMALEELVAEFDAASEEAAQEPGCGGLAETGGIAYARTIIAKARGE